MQHTKSRLSGLTNISTNKATAVIIWLVGTWLTAQLLSQLGAPDPMHWIAGFAIQWVLTLAERPLWRGRGYPRLAIGAALLDSLINGAGALPYLLNLGRTDFWNLINLALQSSSAPTLATILVFCAVIGGAAAALPEYFWSLED